MRFRFLFSAVSKTVSLFLVMLFMSNCSGPSGTPCELEFEYRITNIDDGFGLSESQVELNVEKVLSLWSEAIDSLHVRNSADAPITIQFVYDDRQALTNRAIQLEDNLDSRRMRIDRMREDLRVAEQRLRSRVSEHEELINRISSSVSTLNAFIDERNRAGGLNPGEVSRVESEREVISGLRNQEEQMRERLQQEMAANQRKLDELNREISFSNDLADRFNEEIGPGRYFAGGNFERRGRQGTISIYHFVDERELDLVLAHEIGHALGLGHVENTRSVMYEKVGGQLIAPELRLTAEDTRAIREIAGCGP